MNQIFYFHRYPIYRSETKSNNLKLINSLTFDKNPIEISTQPNPTPKKKKRKKGRKSVEMFDYEHAVCRATDEFLFLKRRTCLPPTSLLLPPLLIPDTRPHPR